MENLIKKLEEGSPDAIRYLQENSFQKIKHFILNNSGQLEDAKDVFHDSIIALIYNIRIKKYKKTAEISTYLYAIARNQWLNQLKKRKKMPLSDNNDELSLFTDENALKDKFLDEERINLIHQKLSELGNDCQSLLKKFYFEGKKLKEIAKLMNYTEQFIRVKKNRCINKLRQTVIEN